MCLTEKVPIAKAEPKNLLTTIRNYMEVSSPHEIHTEMFISLLRVLLNRAPTSTQLHPPPPSSIRLHPAHFNLHRATPTSTQLISTSTQLSATPSTILNQSVARNWAIYPNLSQKIKSCPF